MSMEEMGDGRVMLGWQSKPGMGTTHVPGDGEYKVQGISRAGSTLECHQRFPARSKEQGPCSPKPACLESCGAQSLAGKGAARVMWASRHGDTGSLLGKELKVRLGSGFPEGETSPEAMNTVGSGAVFCKHRGILRNLKKTRRGRNFLEPRGFAGSGVWGQSSACCSAAVRGLPWVAALVLLKELLQEQRSPARSWGEVGAVPTIQPRCVETPIDGGSRPGTQADPTNGASQLGHTGWRVHRMMDANGHLCSMAAKCKESPQKVLGHGSE